MPLQEEERGREVDVRKRLRSDLPYFVFANDFIWCCNSLFEAIISQRHLKMP